MPKRIFGVAVSIHLAFWAGVAQAEPPTTAYIFPAGGQRGTTVQARIGGHFLHDECGFELLGAGVQGPSRIKRVGTLWFEGPVIPMPASQAKEDYPRDYACELKIAPDAAVGARAWRCWTSQGVTARLPFVVGDLPEVIEREIEGPTLPTPVKLPVTINGRIFPREDVDEWSFVGQAGQTVACELTARRIGSPLEGRLEILDAQNRILAESEPSREDPSLDFVLPASGEYRVRVSDVGYSGLQHYVYRLTLTTGPRVRWVYPLGGQAGQLVKFELGGVNLSSPGTGTATSGTGEKFEPKTSGSSSNGPPSSGLSKPSLAAGPVQTITVQDLIPEACTGESCVPTPTFAHRFRVGSQLVNSVTLERSELPEWLEDEASSHDRTKLNPLPIPAVFNGRIGTAGDVDYWAFAGKQGEEWEFDLRAARLGSPLDGTLTLWNAEGQSLLRSEDQAGGPDTWFRCKLPKDGVYYVSVAEQFRGRGGPQFAYRLVANRPSSPDFELTLSTDAVSVERGGKAVTLKVDALRKNYDGEIALEFAGLPAGVQAVKSEKIPAGKTQQTVSLQADATAPLGPVRVTVRGVAQIGGQKCERVANASGAGEEPVLDHLCLGVGIPTPFKLVGEFQTVFAPRGCVHLRRFQVERGGYTGPLTVSLADRQARHLQGVTGPTITLAPDQTEFEYPVYLPPWMEMGRTSRSVLMAIGEVVDEQGQTHRVSHSSQEQNDQIIILVDPGPISLRSERTSLLATPGKTIAMTVEVDRAPGWELPLKLELIVPEQARGLVAPAVSIAAQDTRATLHIECRTAITAAPFLKALVRATGQRDGHPVVAEWPLEIAADPAALQTPPSRQD